MALDRKKIARAIRRRRKELGYTIDTLLHIISPEFISRSTLLRIEAADPGVSASKIRLVMEALQMDPAGYMDVDTQADSSIDSFGLEERLDAERVLLPAESLPLDLPIRNISDLMIYFPLFAPLDIAIITGEIWSKRMPVDFDTEYFFKQLNWLYKKIPPSPAKDYADFLRFGNDPKHRNLDSSTRSKKSIPRHPGNTLQNCRAYDNAVRIFCSQLARASTYSREHVTRLKKRKKPAAGTTAFGAVRLYGDAKNIQWFNIKTPLLEYLSTGSTVVCETDQGLALGILEGYRVDVDTQRLCRELGFLPEHEVVYSYTEMPMEYIYIHSSFVSNPPKREEVSLRRHEWVHRGEFKEDVVIRSDGMLLDGYSAYLAAAELRLNSLYCRVVPDVSV